MSFDSLISTVTESSKEVIATLAAGVALMWAFKDRRRKVALGQMDITKQAQEVISNHVDTMAKLSESVNVLHTKMHDVELREAECLRRFYNLESEHDVCKIQIAELQTKIIDLSASVK